MSVSTSRDSAHAVVLLGYDEAKGIAYYWDPNYERAIRNAPFRVNAAGELLIYLRDYGASEPKVLMWTTFTRD